MEEHGMFEGQLTVRQNQTPPARMTWKLTKDTHAPEGSPGQMLGWLELKALTSQVTPKTRTFLNK